MSEAPPFHCPYAPKGRRRCPPAICDCFIDTHPDDPFGLHPEDFAVMVPCPACGAVGLVGGSACPACGWLDKAP